MKAWTVYEHRSVRFEGAGAMPEGLAGRLHAVSARTGFGGADGNGVLHFGRKSLDARHVVGVVATAGAVLEILPKIDMPGETDDESASAKGGVRRRLIHMLSVALDVRIDADALTALDCQRHTLLELLIRLFAGRLADALRAGMPRRYVDCADDLPALRGRLDAVRQFTVRLADPSRLSCRFEALTPDIALNHIMKAVVVRLLRVARAADTQRMLRELGFVYADIADVPPAALDWDGVVLDRTNARWRDLLALGRLFLRGDFQTSSVGAERGFALLFDMNRLFESYVAARIRHVLVGTDLHVTAQGGFLYCLESESGGLFQTRPDILIKRGATIVQVIDTKWKRAHASIDDKKAAVAQADIYQMMAYGRLYRCDILTLLYPHHARLGANPGPYARHRITSTNDVLEWATIDLARPDGAIDYAQSLADRHNRLTMIAA